MGLDVKSAVRGYYSVSKHEIKSFCCQILCEFDSNSMRGLDFDRLLLSFAAFSCIKGGYFLQWSLFFAVVRVLLIDCYAIAAFSR